MMPEPLVVIAGVSLTTETPITDCRINILPPSRDPGFLLKAMVGRNTGILVLASLVQHSACSQSVDVVTCTAHGIVS